MKWRWKYKILKGLSYLLCSLSYERILSIGKFIGPFILNHIEKQKKRGISQIMTGMEYEQKEAEALLQKVYENIGMTVMEILYMPRLCKGKENLSKYITINHAERLEKAYAEGKGIVGLTAHIGNWEWLGAGLALSGYATSAIGKKQDDSGIMEILNNYRSAAGEHIYLTGTGGYQMIAAARAIKNNHILGFLSDKDARKDGVPVRFMNRIFSFPLGPLTFADKFQAPVIPLFIVRNNNGIGHVIHIEEPFFYERTGNKDKDILINAQRMASLLENFIKAHPDQWMWFQHLFWTEAKDIKRYTMLSAEEKEQYGLNES